MTERIALIHPRPFLTARTGIVLALVAVVALLAIGVVWLHGAPPLPRVSGSNPLYAASGLLVGALVGLTGVGGGALMTPLVVLLFHPSTAVGTDLLYASATKSVGATVHGANKTGDWKITGRMALGSVPATAATVALLYGLHLHGDAAAKLISTVLARPCS